MFSEKDIRQIAERGSDLQSVEKQIEHFKKGFPYLSLDKPAAPNDGIMGMTIVQKAHFQQYYSVASQKLNIVKFVPASGAASRMFKSLFELLDSCNESQNITEHIDLNSNDLQSAGYLFKNLLKFGFISDLNDILSQNGLSVEGCLKAEDYCSLLDYLLTESGLSYGNLPKGLLKFHRYKDTTRTPSEEHLVEGALYAKGKNAIVNIHFTVSPEHRSKFEQHIEEIRSVYEKMFGVKYNISFSEQKAHTDTIAVDPDNTPFREADDSLLFRPAGHGALIENLNDIDADLIFIKNIDNVVPDHYKESTVIYKKVLAGILTEYQEKIFGYLKRLHDEPEDTEIEKMFDFLENWLYIKNIPALQDKSSKIKFLIEKFNRPIRVCGMVKNEGEPGGGPFFARNSDGTVSVQIVESSQIDFSDEKQKEIAISATHFNPVDLVCGVKDYKGNKFDLTRFVDPDTGFISSKSKNGKDLKALELPGLWNGAMSDWNTLFVEVPVSTFNPVKTINDLLRPQHQQD